MSVSVAPLFLLINSLLEKQPQVCYLRSETVEESGVMNSPVNNFMPEHQPILEEVESSDACFQSAA